MLKPRLCSRAPTTSIRDTTRLFRWETEALDGTPRSESFPMKRATPRNQQRQRPRPQRRIVRPAVWGVMGGLDTADALSGNFLTRSVNHFATGSNSKYAKLL